MKENSLKGVSISKTKLAVEGRHLHHITEYQGNIFHIDGLLLQKCFGHGTGGDQ